MAFKFKKERNIVAKEVLNEDTKTFHVDLDDETREIDGVREKFGVQIYSEETTEQLADEEIGEIGEETAELLKQEEPVTEETIETKVTDTREADVEEYEDEDDFYDDDDEYEYVTPNYFKSAVILALVCIIVGALISFLVFKNKMAGSIRAAYEQSGYMITNGCNATAEDIREGKTAYIRGQLVTGTMKDVDTSNATATEADILKGYTAYVNGKLITGSIPTYNGVVNIVPSTTDYKIPKGVYLAEDIIVVGAPS